MLRLKFDVSGQFASKIVLCGHNGCYCCAFGSRLQCHLNCLLGLHAILFSCLQLLNSAGVTHGDQKRWLLEIADLLVADVSQYAAQSAARIASSKLSIVPPVERKMTKAGVVPVSERVALRCFGS